MFAGILFKVSDLELNQSVKDLLYEFAVLSILDKVSFSILCLAEK
ncbi:hypothetical protein PE36_19185 [Moritella sp. PE36]|nr:hypothetical protein PE36_19185 [Moritella sp. PE36]